MRDRNDVRATSSRISAGLKRWLAVLPVLAMAGCAALERQQTTLEALRGELRELAGDVDAVGQSTQDLAGRLLAMEEAIDARLDGIDMELAKPISLPVPVCTMSEAPTAAADSGACEAPVEVVRDGGVAKMTVGAVETIRITPPGIQIPARVDTGAELNSLTATDVVYFERDGDDWLRFDVEVDSATHTIERRLLRHVRVIQQSDVTGTRRPVVMLRVQMGDLLGSFEFNLSDRTHLTHPVILGREFLMDTMLVDVSREFVQPLAEPEG